MDGRTTSLGRVGDVSGSFRRERVRAGMTSVGLRVRRLHLIHPRVNQVFAYTTLHALRARNDEEGRITTIKKMMYNLQTRALD